MVQLSAFIDHILASLLPTGAVAALTNAQTLYLLPVSLFGMSVSASELPEMSSATAAMHRSPPFLRQAIDRRTAAYRASLSFPRWSRSSLLGDIDRGRDLPARQIHACRRDLRLGHPRRFRRRPAGIHAGTPLLIGFLRAERHAHAAGFAMIRVALTTVLGYFCALPLPQWSESIRSGAPPV